MRASLLVPSHNVALLLAVSLIGCAPSVQTAPTPSPTSATPTRTPPQGIHWFRNSAEMRGVYLEVYHAAADQLDKLAAGAAPRTWAVIADADETMIDNSGYNKYQDEIGAAYSDSSWRRYVHEESARALPGAVEFSRLVHRLGGRLVVVTNRENSLCDATHSNLTKDSIEADLVLCRTTTGDKNPRFASVTAGTASPTLPPLKVLMWLGDNIQDFPNLTQKLRDGSDADYSNFGRIYFVFPNPMYGSWERVPYL